VAWRVHSANSAAAVISNVQLFWFVGPAAITDGPTACTDERASAGRGSAAGARSTFMIHHYARSSSRYLFSLHFTLPAADIKRWTCSLVVVIINRAASATSAKIRTAERSARKWTSCIAQPWPAHVWFVNRHRADRQRHW